MTRFRVLAALMAVSTSLVSISTLAGSHLDSDLNQAYNEQEKTYQKIKAYLQEDSHLPSLTLEQANDTGYQIRLIKSKKKLTFVAGESDP